MGSCVTIVALGVVKVVVFVYDVITLPVYFLLQRPWNLWSRNSVWAKLLNPDDLYSPCVRIVNQSARHLEDVQTMDDLFQRSVRRYPERRCFGVREVLGEEEEVTKSNKVFKKLRLGSYRWLTYQDVGRRVAQVSRSLLTIGVRPGRPLVIFAETRLEWMITAQACFRTNVPVVTIYATLGEDGIIHSINETEVTHIVTSASLLPKLQAIVSRTPTVSHVVYMEGHNPITPTGFPDRITVLPFSSMEEEEGSCDAEPCGSCPRPEDLAVIMYTSGSTGTPKGVMITHKNLINTTKSIDLQGIRPDDLYIAYLPLAHVLELSAECFVFSFGSAVGYSSPQTLTNLSTGVKRGCQGDISVLQPTVMSTVPLMLDRIRKSITEMAGRPGSFPELCLQFAVSYKRRWLRYGFQTPLLNRFVLRTYHDYLGGRLRLMFCGGAPLSPDTQEFIRICLNIPVLQGYGMTESTGAATFMDMTDRSVGRVGAPIANLYVRLVDWPEGNYYVTDKPNPRGELVLGGDSVTLGYYKKQALTKEVFTEENAIRWVYTGDIGELYPDGTFAIIDRKKDLVKLQHGDYVALGKVEAELKTCPLVDNVCIYGDPSHNYLVGLVVPNTRHLASLATSLGKEPTTLQVMCEDSSLTEAFTEVLVDFGRKCRLQKTELPARVRLCPDEWSPDTGLVTAAFKLRRKEIQKRYQRAIDSMYGSR